MAERAAGGRSEVAGRPRGSGEGAQRFRPWVVLGALVGIIGAFYVATYLMLRDYTSHPYRVKVSYDLFPSRRVYGLPTGASFAATGSMGGYERTLGVYTKPRSSSPAEWYEKIFLPLEAIEIGVRKRL